MRRISGRAGMTLVEVLIAVVLTAATAAVIYQGIFYSYKTVMRSRMRLDAQAIAFEEIWRLCNQKTDELQMLQFLSPLETRPPINSVVSTNGVIRSAAVYYGDYWKIIVQVWAPSNSPLFSVMADDGTVTAAYTTPLAEYWVLRYKTGDL